MLEKKVQKVKKKILFLHLTEEEGSIVEPLQRRNFEVQGSGTLADTARSIIVAAVARAEETHVDTFVGSGDATKVSANTNDDGVLVLDGEAVLVGLGILQGGEGSFVELLALEFGAEVQEDGLTTPDDGSALLRAHGADFDFDVGFEDHGHLGLTHPPEGADSVTDTESGETDEGGVEDVVHDTAAVFVVDVGKLGLEDVLAEEFFVEHGTGPGGQVGASVLAFDARVGSAIRVGVEDDFFGSINLGEGRVGELTVATVLVGHFLRLWGRAELISDGLNKAVILCDVFIELILSEAEDVGEGDARTTEEVERSNVAAEHILFFVF